MRIKDIIINDLILKSTKGKLNKLISRKTKASQRDYLEKRIYYLEQYVKAARSERARENNLRELKEARYQLQQVAKSL